MSHTTVVYRPPASVGIDELEDLLFQAFDLMRAALCRNDPVVVVIPEPDLLGHDEPVAAALAGGLIGLTRALAVEGARDGWRINALSVSPEVEEADVVEWVERLSDPLGATGALIRLGGLHLGRLPV